MALSAMLKLLDRVALELVVVLGRLDEVFVDDEAELLVVAVDCPVCVVEGRFEDDD
jgi:hypothetical protein